MELKTAELLFQLITGVMIPFAVSSLKQVHWSSQQKFLVVLGLSVLAASVVPLAKMGSGPFDAGSLLESLTVTFTTSQIIYRSVIKSLALEETINPKAALLSAIKEQIILYLEDVDKETAAEVLDPSADRSLQISISEVTME
jgi:hypothetical protein